MTRPGPILGCIADDFTGAVDVAAGTFAAGLRNSKKLNYTTG